MRIANAKNKFFLIWVLIGMFYYCKIAYFMRTANAKIVFPDLNADLDCLIL